MDKKQFIEKCKKIVQAEGIVFEAGSDRGFGEHDPALGKLFEEGGEVAAKIQQHILHNLEK